MRLSIVSLLLASAVSFGATCPQWQSSVQQLSDSEKQRLQDAGAVYGPRGLVISSELVPACRTRVEIQQYIQHAIQGQIAPRDRQTGRKHSAEIRKVLERVWPGLAPTMVISDGARDELYTAILYLNRADQIALTRKLLSNQGISISLADVILRSDLTELGSELTALATASENANEKIYAFTTLAGLRNPGGIEGLKKLQSVASLTPEQSKTVMQVLRKANSHQKITSRCLLDLEYEP